MVIGPNIADHNSTILITKPSNNAKALASCGLLNENLLPTEGIHFQADIQTLLSFLSSPDGGSFAKNQ